MNHDWPVKVFWSKEDQLYIAIIPSLPGCSAVGETVQEALAELSPAAYGWIGAMAAAGNYTLVERDADSPQKPNTP